MDATVILYSKEQLLLSVILYVHVTNTNLSGQAARTTYFITSTGTNQISLYGCKAYARSF